MRRRVLGSIGLTYGILILLYALDHGPLNGTTLGSKVGEATAYVFAGAVIFYSARTLIRAINERDAPPR